MAPVGRKGALPSRAFLSRSHYQEQEQLPWASYLERQLKSAAKKSQEQEVMKPCSTGNELSAATLVAVPQYPVLLGQLGTCAFPAGFIVSDCSTPSVGSPATPSATAAIAGQVWRLSQDPQGSREVQRVLEQAEAETICDEFGIQTSKALEDIAVELRGHVIEAMRCPHANFVLQKCISAAAPISARLFLEELLQESVESVAQAARHRFGCRVIERFLEVCEPTQVAPLADLLVDDALLLFTHPYGNYTMQHLLAHGQSEHRHRLAELLQANAAQIGANFYGCAVVGQALKHVSQEDQIALARSLLHVPGLLVTMARSKHGHSAARLAMQALDGPERDAARREFCIESSGQRASNRKA
mmetsp:Transcript_161144/g.284026  ORF Transcript_161144/g.284026 Transcript_161144/m.284026 type:complete len:358 (+) Transcript_161144:64-1137(+)